MRLAWASVVLLAGCPQKTRPCAPSEPARVEVRDGAGELELAMKRSATKGEPAVYDLCDASARRVGTLEVGEVLGTSYALLLDGAGHLKLRVDVDRARAPQARGPSGPRLTVAHAKTGTEWRVLRPDGVPFGSISPGPDHSAGDSAKNDADVFDPAGRGIAAVKARGPDQVIAGADGTTRRYVIPAASPVAAGLFAVPGLDLDEQLALFVVFPR
jgi:hypothetical protein